MKAGTNSMINIVAERERDEAAREAASLMGRYCDGEVAAFQALYTSLAPRILAYLRGLTGEQALAEDLLQVTFLKLHQARAAYVRDANPVPWIYTIAHRSFLDEARRRKRGRTRAALELVAEAEGHAQLNGEAASGVEAGAAADGVEASTEAALGVAMRALADLPESQRDALLLTKVHGRSLAETAAITGSSVGAIKQRIHRGYLTLRQVLGDRRQIESER
jgi:RNA polymerase sigma-70 factor, ECF subfamily